MKFVYLTYEEYVKRQTEQNIRKFDAVWIREEEVSKIVRYIESIELQVKFGICHGARNGYEVERFRKMLNANIIGTDISPSVAKIEHMIVWDFHEVKPEWINATDFIYTNSFDHCYDFHKALDSWMTCLTDNGRLFIDWSIEHSKPRNEIDCFGAPLEELLKIINIKYKVEEILESSFDIRSSNTEIRRVLVVKKRGVNL